MAGISQKISTEEVLPLLARNVAVEGYQGRKDSKGRPTEFLILLKRYVEQARELVKLAGPEGVIRVPSCEQADPVLAVLGYRMRQGCGKDASLETAEPERAFLTIDSGFPLAELEATLQGGKPFVYPFSVSQVPVLFRQPIGRRPTRKASAPREATSECALGRSVLARLCWAMARMDSETGSHSGNLRGCQAASVCSRPRLLWQPHYDPERTGDGARRASAEPAWKSLAGADPGSAKDFVARLLARMTAGWQPILIQLSRLTPTQQVYFARPIACHVSTMRSRQGYQPGQPGRVPSIWAAAAGNPAPVRLDWSTQRPWEPLEVWGQIVQQKSDSRWCGSGPTFPWLEEPDQLVEAMFAFSRQSSEDGPLHLPHAECYRWRAWISG
jgi:hypothetical protein